jgi:hypothetical protein
MQVVTLPSEKTAASAAADLIAEPNAQSTPPAD